MTFSGAEPLDRDQMRAWVAYMRVSLRLGYEINHQLQEEHGLSMRDYDVLVALSEAPGGTLPLSGLSATIGWELSRVSHHVRRMAGRGLVERHASATDRRVTDAVISASGLQAIVAAAPGHAAAVKRLFFEGLDSELLDPLTLALDQIHDQLLRDGTLPPPTPKAT